MKDTKRGETQSQARNTLEDTDPNLSGHKWTGPYTVTFEASTVKLGSVCRDSSAFSETALSTVRVVSERTQGTRQGTCVPTMGFRRGPENHLRRYSHFFVTENCLSREDSSRKPIHKLQTFCKPFKLIYSRTWVGSYLTVLNNVSFMITSH